MILGCFQYKFTCYLVYSLQLAHLIICFKSHVFTVIILGEQLAVFRDQDGKSYVVDSYCPHLGANLAVGGRVVGNCIECPFHGWQFRGNDGKCVKIPYAEKGMN